MTLEAIFNQQFGRQPTVIARAPGRVNLLGEHVDYNDGFVLPAAIDRSVQVAAAPTTDDITTLYALDLNDSVSFRMDTLLVKQDMTGQPLPDWALYPAGMAWALKDAGHAVCGMQAIFRSDVPIGAGLSSSAAVEMAFGVAWQALGGWNVDKLSMARLGQRAENKYVGVNCGLMDQFASSCGVKGHCLYFDTRSLEWEPVPLPEGTAIVIADSTVRRSLTTSAYNERRAACEKAVELLRQYKPEIRSLRDISTVEFAAYSEFLPAEIRRRAEHVVKEIARVEDAARALKRGDAPLFGGMMYSGHTSLRDLYEVSRPELDTLVNISRNLPGCYGARLTGAGFGGCTVNLVEQAQADAFIHGLAVEYKQQTGLEAQVYLCKASAGAEAKKL
jgi:galactokinase